jgi:AraC-like DNA-binding protein
MPALTPLSRTQFILPTPALQRYLSSYYFFEINVPGDSRQEDLLHPEGASAHFTLSGVLHGSIIGEPMTLPPVANMTGPTIRASLISCNSIYLAGIGILPLGWHRFVTCDANKWANRVGDLTVNPEFALFKTIWEDIKHLSEPREMADIFDRVLLSAISRHDPLEDDIEALHTALTNPELSNVAELAAATGISKQRLERLSRKVFGFPPKLLLRRQRFLRTLGAVMLDPNLKWTAALDNHYHDQAHFNRDFVEFMGMTPSRYLAMPRPISTVSTQARIQHLGDPLQGLQRPEMAD